MRTALVLLLSLVAWFGAVFAGTDGPPACCAAPGKGVGSLLCKAPLGPFRQKTPDPFSGPTPAARVDHAAWTVLLGRYVDERGRVDYTAWKAAVRDTAALDAYLAALSAVDPATLTDDDERIAFWVNAYNAQTIKFILSVWPTKSIRDHTGWIRFNVWEDYPLRVNGRDYSLEDIEHRVLRPMGQPLIHFGLVCASIGCPRLQREAYTGERVISQLETNAREYLGREANFRVDTRHRRVYLSSIFKWFYEDFGNTDRALLDFVAARVGDPETQAFLRQAGLSLNYLDYDWSVNAGPVSDGR